MDNTPRLMETIAPANQKEPKRAVKMASMKVKRKLTLGTQPNQMSVLLGSDVVWSRSPREFTLSGGVEGFEMTERFNVSFPGLPEKSFSNAEYPI